MAREKRSFFDRLTGSVSIDEYDDVFEDGDEQEETPTTPPSRDEKAGWLEEESNEGQLTIDMYQTPDEIVIKAVVAGVTPDNLDVSISRDMVTIRGSREEKKEVEDQNYFYKELYWGSFSRTILLPQEIEVEEATAQEKNGLLTIVLPKIDKEKQTKLKVKSG